MLLSLWRVDPQELKACSLFFIQELEGDEEGEDEDDAEVNPKVSCFGGAFKLCPLPRHAVRNACLSFSDEKSSSFSGKHSHEGLFRPLYDLMVSVSVQERCSQLIVRLHLVDVNLVGEQRHGPDISLFQVN